MLLQALFKIMDIPEEERQYYAAIQCLCQNTIIWAGKDDVGKIRKCWRCETKWKMDDKGEITQC